MKTSPAGRIALAVSEGIVLYPYKDSVGVWTLGIGHTAAAGGIDPAKHIGRQFSMKEVMNIFEKDLKKFEDLVNREVKVKLLQNEFDALVHFAFNTGTLRTKNGQPSKLLKNLNAGNKAAAFQTGFHGWLKPAVLRGRRDKERSIALTGEYGSMIAPLYHADKSGKTIRKGGVDLSYMLKTPSIIAEPKERPIPSPTQQPTPQPQPAPVQQEGFFAWLFRKLRFIS